MSDIVPLFTWVHLSDIHAGHGDARHQRSQELVLSALRADLFAANKKWLPRLNAIIVTGDIAFSGGGRAPSEYSRASEWLESVARGLGLTNDQVFVVPGNHDVQRSVDDSHPEVGALVKSLRAAELPIDSALADVEGRRLLKMRFRKFLKFAKRFGPARPKGWPNLFWTYRTALPGGIGLRLVGLNTAILSAKEEDQQGDLRRLQLGNTQLVRAFVSETLDESEIVVVLSHHPFDWLADSAEVAPPVKKYGHIHLRGHIHEADSERQVSSSGSDLVVVTAGAVHGDPVPPGVPPRHGYSVGSIWVRADGQAVLRLWPRVWSKQHDFRTDPDLLPTTDRQGRPWSNNWVDHELRFAVAGGSTGVRRDEEILTIAVEGWYEVDRASLVKEVYRVAGSRSVFPERLMVEIQHRRYAELRAYIEAQVHTGNDVTIIEHQLEALQISAVRFSRAHDGVKRILKEVTDSYGLTSACHAVRSFLKAYLAYSIAALASYQVDDGHSVCTEFVDWFDRGEPIPTLAGLLWDKTPLVDITLRPKELVQPVRGGGVKVERGPYTRVYVPIDRIGNTGVDEIRLVTGIFDSAVNIPRDVWREHVIPQMAWQEMVPIEGWYRWRAEDSVYDTNGIVWWQGRREERLLERIGDSNAWVVHRKDDLI